MSHQIDHTKPYFDEREARALLEVMKTGLVNEGQGVERLIEFSTGICSSLGGVPVSTGTLGLSLALKAVGVGKESDRIIIPDFACRSLYDAVKMAGGTPVFCDIDLKDYSLSWQAVKENLGDGVKAIILPHMYGCPADLRYFMDLDIPVIEDCAHSVGAVYHGKTVGSFGALTVFSFEGSKLIAAGEGGLVLANNETHLSKLQKIRYGLDGHFAHHYRLGDLYAVIALVQLKKLGEIVGKRQCLARIYDEALAPLQEAGVISLPCRFQDRQAVHYRYVGMWHSDSADLIAYANQNRILMRNPLPSGLLSENFSDFDMINVNAQQLVNRGVSLPIHPFLKEEDIYRVVETIFQYCREKSIL